MKCFRAWLFLGAVAILPALLGACANLGYYAQAVNGHMKIQHRAQPITEILADPNVDPTLKNALGIVVRLREFANRDLRLPDNQSFTTYADLGRPYAVWNVSATPALSLELKKWCFVAAGCVNYRGFFSKIEAERFAAELKAEGYDVTMGGVRAYSTLGWFKDPVLNTFLGHSESELAGLIFHELAHQVIYVRDDSTFNESFATAVELEGIGRWLNRYGTEQQRTKFETGWKRKTAANDILLAYRKRLEALYASGAPRTQKLAAKKNILAELCVQLAALDSTRQRIQQTEQFWERRLNNAYLASISTYTCLVPAFQALLAQHNGDIEKFYQIVRRIAGLPRTERISLLWSVHADNQITPAGTPGVHRRGVRR